MAQVLTAPLALIYVDNVLVGNARNVRLNESFQRAKRGQLGQPNSVELPLVSFAGTLTVGYYNIDFKDHPYGRRALLRRTGNDPQAMLTTMTLQEVGFNFLLLKKMKDTANFPADGRDPATGLIQQATELIMAEVNNVFITVDGFDLSEGQISGRDSTFEYMDPAVFAF